MKIKDGIRAKGNMFFLLLALITFLLSLSLDINSGDARRAADNLGRQTGRRMEVLEGFARQALTSDHEKWLELKDLPKDMVIYRYMYDTLQSWCNQFPVNNDDISTKVVFKTLSSFRGGIVSPLSDITEKATFRNLGPKWFIMKSISDNVRCKVIYGLEIQDKLVSDPHKSRSGVNPNLHLPARYTVTPLSESGGEPVYVGREPLMKVNTHTSSETPFPTNLFLRWLALIFFMLATVFYLNKHTSIRNFILSCIILAVCFAVAYNWGLQLRTLSELFSPNVYADGSFFYSFGALIIMNTFVFTFVICIYICRKQFILHTIRNEKMRGKIIYSVGILLTLAATIAYIHCTLVSLLMNSKISLELYQWNNLSFYTAMVYISYSGLFFCLLLLIQMLKPPVFDVTRLKYNVFSGKSLLLFATLCSLYMSITSGVFGFRKEESMLTVWTNRLAVDRDITLEIKLKSIEENIASDPMIASLSKLERSNIIILNRLTENHLYPISQDYNISVTLCRDNEERKGARSVYDATTIDYFSRKIMASTPIGDGSHFSFSNDEHGNASYIGAFIYYSNETGLIHMFLTIEPKTLRGENGYVSVLGKAARPDQVNLPKFYSYAKYISGKLVSYKGNYPYPTVLDDNTLSEIERNIDHFKARKYIHFVNRVSEEETIISSRAQRGLMTYFISFSYLLIITYAVLYLLSLRNRKNKNVFLKNYYRTRINIVLCGALFLTLIIMTLMSITFVYKRNETNMQNMMSSKISTTQALMETWTKNAEDYHDLLFSPKIAGAMESIGNNTKSDITLYTPGGKVFRSTAPEVFDKMIVGTRMDQNAYYNIKYKNQRFFISREEVAGTKYYSLYAPLFNSKGNMVAILNAPYTDQSEVFIRDAFFHGATIVNLFIILLFATIMVTTTIVNAMFRPMVEMGRKMDSTDIHSLECIHYDRKDEISTLVEAYNRMVVDLSESTKRLAQAERDKAWSEMARQVAHEIKNPLTPIKLEIQRLIRLKNRNDGSWSEKFDKVADVVLEHIDILTDTANEFSTFAKLYSEDPVSLNLDTTLRDQLVIFDNKDNIDISYMGLPDAYVMAPKPQLIRVFVNLFTNAIQAIDIMQRNNEEEGQPFKQGKLLICLRNSMKDGYYDIVFEDNGPGVKEENQERLFTPNFTTKSGGTGLGLAICRNIIEKCNGEITYQRSYALKGACFTVRLPKQPVNQ